MKTRKPLSDGLLKKSLAVSAVLALSACSLVQYQPLKTISKVDLNSGYRLQKVMDEKRDAAENDMLVVLMFSGGGTRAAALGYGVLEELNKQKIWVNGKESSLIEQIDLVTGVSGGSVLAAYFSLHGKDTIPSFERRFLKQNFQRQVAKQVFSAANLPRLTSPEFGRGDLLQEQFESSLFRNATFGDLEKHRKGPFVMISATDMSRGSRIDFTQEYFDAMCLDLSALPLARAVAASSAVPLVFAPITLNNNGGNCGYTLPREIKQAAETDPDKLQSKTRREFGNRLQDYSNSSERPYIHLLDGGLTDNLGLRSLLDTTEIYSDNMVYRQFNDGTVNKIVVINVNAQNQLASQIDQSAAVPGVTEVLNAIINIPIDQYSQESLRRFRAFTDRWNEEARSNSGHEVNMYFISLNLRDLPESQLRENVLNISTSFYLPGNHVNDLKESARVLLRRSKEYNRLLEALAAPPAEPEPVSQPVWFVGEGPVQPPSREQMQGYDALFEAASAVD
ncbi:patatin-like phospholipase family protein [Uruburuella testudinis]|uniref:Patatin-like phospholipase family protein n=1 Tax=Uruburuella testudinis TaxID=1282863 RepID=A0ABY4DQL0_9NEIS|nr:patatin-like phospholipase family protein [Uruburuella testudinis]UOO81014.1 patatin-like phospholipase family protein [Uruburuella testudinis]